jgi:hypothetical protein
VEGLFAKIVALICQSRLNDFALMRERVSIARSAWPFWQKWMPALLANARGIEMAHTEIQLYIYPHPDGKSNCCGLYTEEGMRNDHGFCFAHVVVYNDPALAAHIVLCVNAHDRLVEALRQVRADVEETRHQFWGQATQIRNSTVDLCDAAICAAQE